MRSVLVACEYSGIIREAFNGMGWDSWSCDLLPTEIPGKHIQGDVTNWLFKGWDLLIAHPPCTRLANSGVQWLSRRNLWKEMEEGAEFFKMFLDAPIEKICVENPIQHHFASDIIGVKYSQIIQPFQFGHKESKATCLWLKGLPKLVPTDILDKPESGIWDNQTLGGQNNTPPGKDRWKKRSKTYYGIANAMAKQWSHYESIRPDFTGTGVA